MGESYDAEIQDQANIDMDDKYHDIIKHYLKNLTRIPHITTFHTHFIADQIVSAVRKTLNINKPLEEVHNDLMRYLKK